MSYSHVAYRTTKMHGHDALLLCFCKTRNVSIDMIRLMIPNIDDGISFCMYSDIGNGQYLTNSSSSFINPMPPFIKLKVFFLFDVTTNQ